MAAPASTLVRKPTPNPLKAIWNVIRPIARKPEGIVGLIGVGFFVVLAFVGPLFIARPETNIDQLRQPPTLANPLGTDNNGKSILVLLIRGGQDVMATAFVASILSALIGVTFGALAAYLGGVLDQVLTSLANFILTLPVFILLTVLSTIIRLDNTLLLSLLLAAFSWPILMRTVRAQVLSLRERDYIEAAVSLGLGTRHIITMEILPNMASYIIVSIILSFTNAIYSLIALTFLGFVPISVKDPNWGVIIRTASTAQAINNPDTTWWILGPVLAIAVLQWCMITLARSIEDAFNPRLRSSS